MIGILQKYINKIFEYWKILVFFLIAFLFRFVLTKSQFVVSFDEVNYLKLAADGALHGFNHVFHTYWSPFYPLVVSLFLKMTDNFEFTARLVSVLSGSLLIIPIYFLARIRLSPTSSLITIALLAIYPPLALLSTKILTESLYTFLGVSGILIAWYSIQKQSRILAFIIGIIFGMTYLTRPEGIGFIVVFVFLNLFLLIKNLVLKNKNKYFQLILFSILGFMIISSPYLLFLHKKTGTWTISAKRKSLQQAEADVFKNRRKDRQFRKLSDDNKSLLIDQMFHTENYITSEKERGKPVIQVTLSLLIQKYFKNLYEMSNVIVPKVIPLSLAVFFFLGLFNYIDSREKNIFDLYLLSYIIFFWGIIIPMFHINHRYFLPLLPLCFIWAGKGVILFYNWLQNLMNRLIHKKICMQALSLTIVLIFISVSFVPVLAKVIFDNSVKTDRWSNPVEYKKAGLWLKENCDSTPIVMSHYQTVSYYAGNYDISKSVSIPFNRIERVLAYARYRDVDYIVLSERYVKLFPRIRNLFYMKNIPEELKMVHNFKSKSGLQVVIYQLIYDKRAINEF